MECQSWRPPATTQGPLLPQLRRVPKSAFLSSGTWSLLGAELPEPMLTARACALNFTNEGGVCRTVRLLKNIAGLWLLAIVPEQLGGFGQEHLVRRTPRRGKHEKDTFSFADRSRLPRISCARTTCPPKSLHIAPRPSSQHPQAPPAFTRTILESLAFKYREVLESLEDLTGTRIEEIRIMGGGSKNRVLNQFTANATGRTVVAGPAEATALGNIAMQMLATGAVSSLRGSTSGDRPFVSGRAIRSDRDGSMELGSTARFKHYCEEVHA